jgi:SagB-type dehydrogenase family enzyme
MLNDQIQQKPLANATLSPQSHANENKKIKPEFTSFLSLFLIGLVVVLGVLLLNEKRTQPSFMPNDDQLVAEQSETKYEMPKSKAIREVVELPAADIKGKLSVEETIQNRRSKRLYSDVPVTKQELAQLLWSAQGITDKKGYRTAPSAKGAYPFSLYVVVRNVEDIDEGLYLYNSQNHTLGNLGLANAGQRLIEAGVQDTSKNAPVVIVLVATPAKMLEKFPDSNPMPNVYLEGGHIGQNIYLQVESLGMATVVTGGFNKQAVAEALELDPVNQTVVYLVPFGNIGEAPELVEVK